VAKGAAYLPPGTIGKMLPNFHARKGWLRPATIQHFHAVQAGNQGLSCPWAKTESRPSTSRPR
jgi:hypothetical protein